MPQAFSSARVTSRACDRRLAWVSRHIPSQKIDMIAGGEFHLHRDKMSRRRHDPLRLLIKHPVADIVPLFFEDIIGCVASHSSTLVGVGEQWPCQAGQCRHSECRDRRHLAERALGRHRARAPEDKRRALPGQDYARTDERYTVIAVSCDPRFGIYS
jgi:hypothetical protein